MKLMHSDFQREYLTMSKFPRNFLLAAAFITVFGGRALGRDEPRWNFIDTQGGGAAALWGDEKRIVFEGQGLLAEFCEVDSAYHCFSSELFEFSVPKTLLKQVAWSNNGRVYCVENRYEIESGEKKESISLIFSKMAKSCDAKVEFDMTYIYSTVYGLRLMTRRIDNGIHEFYSLDKFGFASTAK